MKRIINTFLSLFLLMLCLSTGMAKAENLLVREDRIWNYELHSIYGSTTVTYEDGYHFKGKKTIDGVEYSIFLDGKGNELGYLREEEGKVYRYLDGNQTPAFFTEATEYLLYDFNAKTGDEFSCVGFDENMNHFCEMLDAKVAGVSEIAYRDITYECQHLHIKRRLPETDYQEAKVVVGVGSLSGLLMAPQFVNMLSGLQWKYYYLRSMTTTDGEVLFRSDYGNIPENEKLFNPENTWEYVNVYYTFYDKIPIISLTPYVMDYSGTETKEGKEYNRYDWMWKNTSKKMESYYLLREENGAYYVCVGDENEEAHWGLEGIQPGEYLLYDFNMEEGDEYEAPCSVYLNEKEGLVMQTKECYMGRFVVSKKSIDEEGRRVLVLDPVNESDDDYKSHVDHGPQTIVEGVGPITGQSNVAAFYFPYFKTCTYVDFLEFYGVFSPDGDAVYLTSEVRGAGFWKEKDYTWVYGIYDSKGKVSYMKMEFNYYGSGFRRFINTQVSESLDGGWYRPETEEQYVYYLREEDGKVYTSKDNLLYDFNASDNSMLRIDTTEGFQDFNIKTSFTEVGGEETRSYTFEDSNGVKCVEGIGVVQGGILPCVNSRFKLPVDAEDDSYCGAVLLAVYDGEGNLIFSQEMPSGIGEITPDSTGWVAPADRLYDLQGRELSEPQPGQPYIRAGKIHIAK